MFGWISLEFKQFNLKWQIKSTKAVMFAGIFAIMKIFLIYRQIVQMLRPISHRIIFQSSQSNIVSFQNPFFRTYFWILSYIWYITIISNSLFFQKFPRVSSTWKQIRINETNKTNNSYRSSSSFNQTIPQIEN